jgi:hypothetical protein
MSSSGLFAEERSWWWQFRDVRGAMPVVLAAGALATVLVALKLAHRWYQRRRYLAQPPFSASITPENTVYVNESISFAAVFCAIFLAVFRPRTFSRTQARRRCERRVPNESWSISKVVDRRNSAVVVGSVSDRFFACCRIGVQ